jgi:hypothetical protein
VNTSLLSFCKLLLTLSCVQRQRPGPGRQAQAQAEQVWTRAFKLVSSTCSARVFVWIVSRAHTSDDHDQLTDPEGSEGSEDAEDGEEAEEATTFGSEPTADFRQAIFCRMFCLLWSQRALPCWAATRSPRIRRVGRTSSTSPSSEIVLRLPALVCLQI